MIDCVVLTDFSTAADKALHYTTMLARQVPAKIHLLHFWHHAVWDPDYLLEEPTTSAYFPDFPVATRLQHEQALEKRVEAFGREVAVAPHFMTGPIADKLPACLELLANPLVVLGKSYTGDIPDALVESTAVRLLSLTKAAFLIVPESYQRLDPPRRIAIALHEKEIKQRDHVFEILTSALHPEINIVHVCAHPDEAINSRLAQQAEKGLGLAAAEIQIIQKNSVMKGIKKYCREHEEDLLVLVHREHSYLLDFFHQSITGNFIRHTSIPLLILPG